MYLPERFKGVEWEEVVREHPLATVISARSEGVIVSHLPLLFEKNKNRLLGHLALANPHSAQLEIGECIAIFHGPEAYISPLWYEECDVPTWNYLVVHFRGKARLLPEEECEPALRALSDRMEGAGGWEFQIPPDLEHSLHRVIVAFEIQVTDCQVKFKLSQNRSAADRRGVVSGLRAKGAASGLAVAGWMAKIEAGMHDAQQ